MEIQRKALFNLLRMNWLIEPMKDVVGWQVEDYRQLSTDELFKRLEQDEIRLNIASFIAHAEPFESPEDFSDDLLAESRQDAAAEDRVFLSVFELWRRLMPEKASLSLFCDELDYQIALYDAGELQTPEHLEDALANLQAILDENTDLGNDAKEVFQTVSTASANDLEEFLYDFIAQQLDQDNVLYATELLDGFYEYMSDTKWFDLLRARNLALRNDVAGANTIVRQLIGNESTHNDLVFNLDLLAFLVLGGERDAFVTVVKDSLSLITEESELQDLLTICADYYQRLDLETQEHTINGWLKERATRAPEANVTGKDPVFGQLLALITES